MNRRLGLLLAGACTFAAVGLAQAGQSNTGCGLGSMLFKDQEGLLSQVCAVTFNGSFGNQTFAITTGSLNCEKPAAFSANEKLNKFVSENMDNLAMDISRGSGEYLSTLAVLMETTPEQRAGLYQTLQANFSSIYTSETVTHVEVLDNIERLVTAS
jgi:hypothetical protein